MALSKITRSVRLPIGAIKNGFNAEQAQIDTSFIEGDAVYLQEDYPELYAAIGLVGASPFNAANPVTSNNITSLISNGQGQFLGLAGSLAVSSNDAENWFVTDSGIPPGATAIAQGQNKILFGTSQGSIQYSTDNGETWNNSLSNHFNSIFSIIYGNDLFLFSSTLGTIKTSTDAVNWTFVDSESTQDIRSLAYNPDSGIYVYVGGAGNIGTSTDAVTWTPVNSTVTVTLNSVVYGNGNFLAAGNSGVALTSTDGTAWVNISSNVGAATSTIDAVTYGNNLYVLFSRNTNRVLNISTDLQTWYTYGSGTTGQLSVFFKDRQLDRYYLAAGTNVGQSIDGSAYFWNTQAIGSGLFSNIGVVHTGSEFIRITQSNPHVYFTSQNGRDWSQASNNLPTSGLTSNYFKYSTSGNLYILIYNATRFRTSTDATTWTGEFQVPISQVNDVEFDNNLYVAVGNAGNIWTSTDAATWTSRTSGTTDTLFSIAHGAGRFVAVGQNGVCRTSTNGISWAASSSGTSWGELGSTNTLLSIRKVVYKNNLFLSGGDLGHFSTSTDGVTWTSREPPTRVVKVIYNNGLYVRALTNGEIHTSTNIREWTVYKSGATARINAMIYAEGIYMIVGNGGYVATSTNAINWTQQTSGTTTDINCITYGVFNPTSLADGGSCFVIGGGAGMIRTSVNKGVTWTARTSGTSAIITALAHAKGTYVYGTSLGEIRSCTYADSEAWTQRRAAPSPTRAIISFDVTKQGIISTEVNGWSTSTDGISWSGFTQSTITYTHATDDNIENVSSIANYFYWTNGSRGNNSNFQGSSISSSSSGNITGANVRVRSSCRINYSNDWKLGGFLITGDGFSDISPTGSLPQQYNDKLLGSIRDIDYLDGKYIFVGEFASIATTTDFNDWQVFGQSNSGGNTVYPYQYIAIDQSAPSGEKTIVVLGNGRQGYSTNSGELWQHGLINTGSAISGDAVNGQSVIGNSSRSLFITNPDQSQSIGHIGAGFESTSSVFSVTYGADKYVVAATTPFRGNNRDEIIYSSNGTTWTSVQNQDIFSTRIEYLNYLQGKFYGVGDNGLIATSTDAVDWYSLGPSVPLAVSIISVAYSSGKYIFATQTSATNVEQIGTSTDGINWKKSNPFPSVTNFRAVYTNGSSYIAATNSAIFKSDDGVTWKGVSQFISRTQPDRFRYINDRFVAVGTGNFDYLYSTDGETWINKRQFLPYNLESQIGGGILSAEGPQIVLCAANNNVSSNNNDIATSTNGTDWTPRFAYTGSSPNRVLRSVTYGDGLYVAVGDNIAVTSTDAITWAHSELTTTQRMNSVAYGNGVFVAVGIAARIMITRDPRAEKWSESRLLGTIRQFNSVAFGNNRFLILGDLVGARIDTTTTNGRVFEQTTFNTSTLMRDVAYNSVNAIWMAVGNSGWVGTANYNSETSWTTRSTGSTATVFSVTYGKGVFVIGQQGFIRTTTNNGASWTTVTNASYVHPVIKYSSTLDLFVGVLQNGGQVTSTDGFTWVDQLPNFFARNDIAYGNNLYVTVRASGQIHTSTDLETWTLRTSNTSTNLNSITFSGTLFVAGGVNGTIVSSTDGITWSTARSVGNTQNIRDIEYINDEFVYVTDGNGIIGTSTDSFTWETKTSLSQTLNTITYSSADNQYVVSGNNAVLRTSTDLVTWKQHGLGRDPLSPSETQVTGRAIDYYNGIFLHGTTNGSIRTSTDGSDWTVRPNAGTQRVRGFAYVNNEFYLYGDGGSIRSSTDAVTWTARTAGVTSTIYSLIYSNSDGVFFQASDGLRTTTDFDQWTVLSGATFGTVASVVYTNDKFYAGTNTGRLFASTAGLVWNIVEDRYGYSINGITSTDSDPATVFYVHSSGGLARSTDDINWDHYYSISNSTGTVSTINSVTYGNNVYVAGGNGGILVTSTDGRSWLSLKSITTTTIQNVYYSSGEYLVTGNNGLFLRTTNDFLTTSTVTTGITTTIFTSLKTNTGFYLIGRSGADIQTSTNLTRWLRYGATITSIPSISNTSALIATTFTNQTLTSSNWLGMKLGITTTTGGQTVPIIGAITGFNVTASVEEDQEAGWDLYPSVGSITITGVTAGISNSQPRIYITTTDSAQFTNASGVFQRMSLAGFTTTTTRVACIELTPDERVIAGGDESRLWIGDTAGTSMPTQASGITGLWVRGICTNRTTPFILAVGSNSTNNSGFWVYTNNLSTWTFGTTFVSVPLNSATFNGTNLYVIVGNAGTIASSSTITGPFTVRTNTAFYNQNINKVIFGAGVFVFGGEDGTIASSTDAITWVRREAGTSNPIRGLSYDSVRQKYFLLDSQGAIRSSTDLSTWEVEVRSQNIIGDPLKIVSGNNVSLYYSTQAYGYSQDNKIWQSVATTTTITDITFGNNLFVMTFANGLIRTSTDAVTWTDKLSGTNNIINAIYYDEDIAIYVGNSGAISYADDLDTSKYSTFYDASTEFYVPSKLLYSSETLPVDGTTLKTFVKARP